MNLEWIAVGEYDEIPDDAIVAGEDIDGSTIYVGRAYHQGNYIPAKAIPSRRVAYVPWGGHEHVKNEYELLCGEDFKWVPCSDGDVPPDAVRAGTDHHEPVYIGRARIRGSQVTGKILPSHSCIYVPFDGKEHRLNSYEVLVEQKGIEWVHSSIHASVPHGAVLGGRDQDGTPMYIGRAFHHSDELVAKVLPTKRQAYVCHDGREIAKTEYEVLCNGKTSWVRSYPSERSVPSNAVCGGVTSSGELLYIGRAHYEGSLTVGKLHVSHGALYIPFGGAEIAIRTEVELLVEH